MQNLASTAQALKRTIDDEDFGFITISRRFKYLVLPVREKLPNPRPVFSSTGGGMEISDYR